VLNVDGEGGEDEERGGRLATGEAGSGHHASGAPFPPSLAVVRTGRHRRRSSGVGQRCCRQCGVKNVLNHTILYVHYVDLLILSPTQLDFPFYDFFQKLL
jgi:hypothetical protein